MTQSIIQEKDINKDINKEGLGVKTEGKMLPTRQGEKKSKNKPAQ